MIPPNYFTIWLGGTPPPEYQKCIDSQIILPNHQVITLDDAPFPDTYFWDCVRSGHWVKASDYLRAWWVYKNGGIYLDADVEVIEPLPNEWLKNDMFCLQEEDTKIFSNAIFGAKKKHPLLGEYIRRLQDNFKGSGDLIFEPGVRAFADLIWTNQWPVARYPMKNKYLIHHSLKSWKQT